MNSLEISVRAEYTPNPNSLKFISSESLIDYPKSFSYLNIAEAEQASNQLAIKLFGIEGIIKVFIMNNFVTVDKEEHINWKDVHLEIKEIIKTSIVEIRDWAEANKPDESEIDTSSVDGDARSKIEAVLDKIRPALVADGGNIEFVDLIDKDARLRMVGACGTCPSAMMTMKMGVERALLAEVPDLVETVTQVF
ncbi:MAG: NifU family protein [Candidatus Melainabacteria bacterium]|nr:NifU family protein [Candidatus Melainabacteria bacterium]